MSPNSDITVRLFLYLPILTFRVPEVVGAEFKFIHFRHAESQNQIIKI